jgi:dynein heavy chain
VTW